jgi:drug/metabolite transporter (DMT)-like permease
MQATRLSAPQLTQRIPLGVLLSLLAVYVIWGSTYLALRVAVAEIPPFFLMGTRFITAGVILFPVLRMRGAARPTRTQWLHSLVVGALMLGGGMGGVAFAEQWVSSSLAAALVATAPLWIAIFSGLNGQWPSRLEWLGILIGFTGVVLLNLEGEMRANPLGALAMLLAPIFWATGSVLSRRLQLPEGAMGTAAEMLTGGPVLMLMSLLSREQPGAVSAGAFGAWFYLVTFGSLIAFSAYMYLIRTVRPALAISYAYVNPVVALGLGMALLNERITPVGLAGIAVIVVGVICLTVIRAPQSKETA